MKTMRIADTPLDAGSEVIAFHDIMLSKGNVFYGVAVQPPKGREDEVKARLERILLTHGHTPNLADIGGYVVFEGEFSGDAMEAVRKYLTSIETLTPTPPVMRRGDYFQMGAYKWLDGLHGRNGFR